jgi:bifunctional non-homologous end joining protein LigD
VDSLSAAAPQYFGALLLGAYDRGKLHFVGKSARTERQNSPCCSKFKPRPAAVKPFRRSSRERDVTFLSPKPVAQISYQEWTSDKKLRQPVFLGLRDDKGPREVRMPEFAT